MEEEESIMVSPDPTPTATPVLVLVPVADVVTAAAVVVARRKVIHNEMHKCQHLTVKMVIQTNRQAEIEGTRNRVGERKKGRHSEKQQQPMARVLCSWKQEVENAPSLKFMAKEEVHRQWGQTEA